MVLIDVVTHLVESCSRRHLAVVMDRLGLRLSSGTTSCGLQRFERLSREKEES